MTMPEKQPPQSVEAEEALLGALLIDPTAVALARDRLQPSDFYREKNGWLYEALLAVDARGAAPDLVTLCEELERRDRLHEIGGREYLTALLNAVPSSVHAVHYADIVRRKATLRRVIKAASRITSIAWNEDDEDVEAAVAKADAVWAEVRAGSGSGAEMVRDADMLMRLVVRQDEVAEARQAGKWSPDTPWPALNGMIGGFVKGSLTAVAGPSGMGKCVDADTLIMDTLTGSVRTVAEWHASGALPTVPSITSSGRVLPVPVARMLDNGMQECYEVVLQGGRRVVTTAEHPFLTGAGWRRYDALRVGDWVATPLLLPFFGNVVPPKGAACLLGYLLGDGGLTSYPLTFTNIDPVVLEDVQRCLDASFPGCRIVHSDRITYGIRDYAPVGRGGAHDGKRGPAKGTFHNRIKIWLAQLGMLGVLSKNKTIPAEAFLWDRDAVADLLCGLFTCDGGLSKNGKYVNVSITSASETLMRQVAHLLLRFGIHGAVRERAMRCGGKMFAAWTLTISERRSVVRFAEDIGFVGKKQDALEQADSPRKVFDIRVPPEVRDLIRSEMARSGITRKAVMRKMGLTGHQLVQKGYGVTCNYLARIADACGSEALRQVADADIRWLRIRRLCRVGPRHVFDMVVPETHAFVGNDILVHNTTLMDCVAEHNARCGQRVLYFHYEISEDEMAQRKALRCGEGLRKQDLREGAADRAELSRLANEVACQGGRVTYIHCTDWTPERVAGVIRREAAVGNCTLAVVDYVQIMPLPEKHGRTDEMALALGVAALKTAAEMADVPVIIGSQVTKEYKGRSGPGPRLTMSDIRGSGQVAEKSNLVLLLWNESVVNPSCGHTIADLYVGKNTFGEVGMVQLFWDRHKVRFLPIDKGF